MCGSARRDESGSALRARGEPQCRLLRPRNMRARRRRSAIAGTLVIALVVLTACSHGGSAASATYLVDQASRLGRCTLGEGGDFGAPFDATRAESWDRLNGDVQAWARVLAWRIASKPKDPPGDFTVMVQARFDILRGSREAVRPTVGAHQRDAESIANALKAGLDVYVGVRGVAGGPYVAPALALDKTGRLAWLGECAGRNSVATAASLERAKADPKQVAPAVRRWLSDGDTHALLRALT